MKKHWFLIRLILALCFATTICALPFDIDKAQRDLQDVNSYIEQSNVNPQVLKNMQKRIAQIKEQAILCINDENVNLSEIASLQDNLNKLSNKSAYTSQEKYIEEKENIAQERLFSCKLYVMQSTDTQQALIEKSALIAKLSGKPVYEAISGIFLTIGAILIFTAIVFLGNIIFDHAKLNNLSFMKRQRYPEFIIFKFSLYAFLAIWVVLMLLEWWGVPANILEKVKTGLIDGGTVYGVKMIPLRLLLGIMVFALIQISWKFSLLYIAKRQKIDPEADSHVVLTSLLSYVVFTIAILIGLGISGVNFTGLAIFAGALTVGIGFGLQNIVNNFVSGIILLLEKTIKPGDRVSIKGYEGFVRKINLRFTRISTPNKDDILIPNSDLISSPIINFEFEDKLAKIKCIVGVAYGSDLELVRQTLLNIAVKHIDVLNDPLNKPRVFLNELGESNIIFELECTIIDVNRKHSITSDMYFKIATTLDELKIETSYPKREIHVIQEG